MQFVFPWFLLALLTLAIPVIIHLFHFRRYKKIYFSDIRFLQEVQEEKKAINNLRKRLILAARLLALLFLVLAFTQPFLRKNKNNAPAGNVAVAVYIDNSYSMGLQQAGEDGLSVAKEKAAEIVRAYSGADRFALLTNDRDGSQQRWMLPEDFLNAVEKVSISPNSRRIDDIAKTAASLFASAGNKQKVAFFISDYQQTIATSFQDTSFQSYFLPVQATSERNVYADSCWLEQPVFTQHASNKMMVRFRNAGNTAAENIRVSVKINNEVKAMADLTLAAGETRVDTFRMTVVQSGWQKGEIVFNDYPITFDDRFYFSFFVGNTERILNITDAGTPENIAALFSGDEHFQLISADKNKLDYSGFGQYAMIILNELSDISSGLAAVLKEYLAGGGIVYVIPGKEISLSGYNHFLSANQVANLGQLQRKKGAVTGLNTEDNIWKSVFVKMPKNPELPAISAFYPIESDAGHRESALLYTNTGAPLAARYDAGNGYVYLQAVPLHTDFSQLAVSALLPPLLYNAAVFRKQSAPLYYVIGKDELIEVKDSARIKEQVYRMTNGNNEFIPENRSLGNTTLLRVNTTLPEAGHYTVMAGNNPLKVTAFNFDRSESQLVFTDKDKLKQRYSGKNQQILENTQANIASHVKQIKDGILLWKVCVILSLIFILTEILLIRYWK